MRGSAINRSSLNNRRAEIASTGSRASKVKLRWMFGDLDSSDAAGLGARRMTNRADTLSGTLTSCQFLKDSSRRFTLGFYLKWGTR